jgi:hypothetical protein
MIRFLIDAIILGAKGLALSDGRESVSFIDF